MKDANEILNEAETKRERIEPHLRDVANWFHEREGELPTRVEATDSISAALDVDEDIARDAVRNLVGDIVDPVVQVPVDRVKYIGVISYEEYDGAYGYTDYDDVAGERPRVVCAQCVHEATTDAEVTHATAGEGSFDDDADAEGLLEAIHAHYEDAHDGVIPEEVETGASLLATTINGNEAWHAGNDGSSSGLDADVIEGRRIYTQTTAPSSPSAGDLWIDTS